MLKGLSHVAVLVTDLERSLEFYTKIPGIEEHFRLTWEDGRVRLVYLRVGRDQFIELFPRAEQPFARTSNAGLDHFCLEVDDIRAMQDSLAAKGILPTRGPNLGADGAWQFWVQDPDGNFFEFHQFTPDSMQLAK
ncbi:MAG: VOC family protein [Armatimonadota bacterium]